MPHAPSTKVFPRPGYEHSEECPHSYAYGYDVDDEEGMSRFSGSTPMSTSDIALMDGMIQGAHDRGDGCIMPGQAMIADGYVDIFHAHLMRPSADT